MADAPDLNRRWTFAEAAADLRARGISLTSQADGYRLNYTRDGTAQTEIATDDLIEALVAGYAMATRRPKIPKPLRRRRRPSRKARIRSHNRAVARRQWKKKATPGLGASVRCK